MRFSINPPAIYYQLRERSSSLFKAPKTSEITTALGTVFTPSYPITNPGLFSGRESLLNEIREKLSIRGQNVLIFGRRGLGKTSLALVALHGLRIERYTCSDGDDFVTIFLAILVSLNEQFSPSERTELRNAGYEIGGTGGKLSAKIDVKRKESALAQSVLNPNLLMTKLAKWKTVLRAIVIDEFQEIKSAEAQQSVIQTAKILSDNQVHIPLVIIAHSDSEAAVFQADKYHEYKDRFFSIIEIPEMTEGELTDIIHRRAARFKVQFRSGAQQDIVRIAAGYPTVVHSLALFACFDWAARNAEREMSTWTSLENLRHQGTLVERLSWDITAFEVSNAVQRFVNDYRRRHRPGFDALISKTIGGPANSPAARAAASVVNALLAVSSETPIDEREHSQAGTGPTALRNSLQLPFLRQILRATGYLMKTRGLRGAEIVMRPATLQFHYASPVDSNAKVIDTPTGQSTPPTLQLPAAQAAQPGQYGKSKTRNQDAAPIRDAAQTESILNQLFNVVALVVSNDTGRELQLLEETLAPLYPFEVDLSGGKRSEVPLFDWYTRKR